MSTISCYCFNIRVQLVSPPSPTTDQKWLAEQMGAKKVGEAKIKVSGPTMELDSLVNTRLVSGWKVWKCCNCNVDVCATDLDKASTTIVNLDLEGNIEPTENVREDEKRFYSPCFHIVLEEEDDDTDILGVANKNTQAVETFNNLQHQVDTFVTAEERAMERAIRAFIKEKQEAFNTVKSRANKDRAILWRRICKINAAYASLQNTSTASSSSSNSNSGSSQHQRSVFKVAASAPSSIAPIVYNSGMKRSNSKQDVPAVDTKKSEEKSPTQPEKKWQSAEKAPQKFPLNSSTPSDADIFSFDEDDEEEERIITPRRGSQREMEKPKEKEEPISDDEDSTPSTESDSVKYMATSLPVRIAKPPLFGRLNERRESNPPQSAIAPVENPSPPPPITPVTEVQDDGLKETAPRASWSSSADELPANESWATEVGEEIPAEVAASFAVPLSLNRRIKSLI